MLCMHTDSLEDYCHGCGMCDHDSAEYTDDSDWVNFDHFIACINS